MNLILTRKRKANWNYKKEVVLRSGASGNRWERLEGYSGPAEI
jgi:hypothetical protein